MEKHGKTKNTYRPINAYYSFQIIKTRLFKVILGEILNPQKVTLKKLQNTRLSKGLSPNHLPLNILVCHGRFLH